ncbi:MAG: hypothetical protein HY659_01380 [Rhizobiales bacterium]|nr:hypothetical protein [Hyphomicrobiales bacterium]
MSYSDPYPHPQHARERDRRAARNLLALPIALFFGFVLLALAYVAYVLWPRWPAPVADGAPSLPITVAGVTFNVPPAAIRVAMQRRAGPQQRLDLAYLWPSLAPPDPKTLPAPTVPGQAFDRMFVTITNADGALPPVERFKTIYPRYLELQIISGPDGLAVRPFRDGSPYQGEDLIYDPAAPEPFILRCSRDGSGQTAGICLYDRRMGAADITVRFPRSWLSEWRNVSRAIDKLVAGMKPSGG